MAIKVKQMLCPVSKKSIKFPYAMTPTRIVVHNTANDASAVQEITYMNNNNNKVSFHFAIDDKEVVQGLPLNVIGWHAGDGAKGKGNREGIAIEICYSKSGGSKFIAAEKLAAKFIAQLLFEHNWGMEKVTKHQDYSGKYCPHRTLDMGWSRFLNMVKTELDVLKKPATTTKPTTTKPVATTTTTGDIAAGTKLTLKNISLYASSSVAKKSSSKTGTYYVWSKDVVNNRIRITNSKANVGKSGQVTGWINYADAKKSVSTTTSSTTATSKPATKSLDDWAKEVINGKHGNGMLKRMTSLKKAGCPYSYAKVQARVNALLKKK